MRKIIHIDMDAFYASVAQRDRPELQGLPVIVAWSPEPRGVVVAASYEARSFGVRSAMPATRALRLCPEAVWVTPDFERYREVSNQIREIFHRHTALVEPLALDEAYLDVTEELTGLPTATETAVTIRREIQDTTHLTASAGVAPNKFLAKIASDWRKPDGLFVIKPHQVDAFLAPLPVGKLPGVGPATERVLASEKIATVADLRNRDRAALEERFGKFGGRLWELAFGIDETPVVPFRHHKSISSETTFETDLTLDEVSSFLDQHAPSFFDKLAKRERVGRTVTVKLRTSDFTTATRRQTPSSPPASAEEFTRITIELLSKFEFPSGTRYRLAGFGMSNFTDEDTDRDVHEVPPTLFP